MEYFDTRNSARATYVDEKNEKTTYIEIEKTGPTESPAGPEGGVLPAIEMESDLSDEEPRCVVAPASSSQNHVTEPEEDRIPKNNPIQMKGSSRWNCQ